MGQGRAQASPLILRGINDPRADEKPAEARFRGCESEHPINSKETDTIPEILGKRLSLFGVKGDTEKGATFFQEG